MARLVFATPEARAVRHIARNLRQQRRLQPRLTWPQATDASPELGVCRVVVLDTETTGLDQTKDKIMELALLRVDVDRATGLPVGPVQVYDGL